MLTVDRSVANVLIALGRQAGSTVGARMGEAEKWSRKK